MVDIRKIIPLLRSDHALVLATLVEVRGGSSKRLGARAVWMSDRGFVGSLTAGGCVDAEASRAAARVAESGRLEMIGVELGDEGFDFGMSCAGSVRVFVEPLTRVRKQVIGVFEDIRAEHASGRAADLILSLDERNDRYAVSTDALHHARYYQQFLERTPAALVRDGETELFLERFSPPPRLIVIGASPIADPLVRLGVMVGFETIVVTASEVASDRFADADQVHTGVPSDICSTLNLNTGCFAVVTAHDYKHEVPVLRELAPKMLGYLGFVASRRRGSAVLKFLRTTGQDSDAIDRIRVPVGLEIGAVTPEEIAISIVAEVLAVRNGTAGGSMSRTPLGPEALHFAKNG